MKSHLRKQIVVLGGGFAGLAASLQLAKERGFREEFNVTLVDKNCYHLYHGLLYEVATAHFDIRPADIEYLQGGVCIRLKALGELVTKRQIDFLQATVTGIETSPQRVRCSDQPDIPYDHLVLALGSEPTDFGMPGVREHALFLHDIPDALSIRERIRTVVAQRRRSTAPYRIVIAGGGFTGVELAGELLEYVRRLERDGALEPQAIHLTIVEASDCVLKSLGKQTSRLAQRRLEELGARFFFARPIAQVEEHVIVLQHGKRMPFDLLVWSAGIQANPLLRVSGLPTVGRGQVSVEPTLRVTGTSNIWAAGDCVAFVDPMTHRQIPQVAPLAVEAGRLVAKNIVRSIGGQTLHPFVPRHFGFVIPVGGKFAIARTKLLRAHGFIAWLLRKLIDLDYFMSIMSLRNALRVFFRGAKVYVKND